MSRGEFLERVRAGQVNWMWERMGRTEWAISRLNLHTPVCVVPWESHIGLNQGLLAALVTDVAPADRRGTAADCFNVMSGLCHSRGSWRESCATKGRGRISMLEQCSRAKRFWASFSNSGEHTNGSPIERYVGRCCD